MTTLAKLVVKLLGDTEEFETSMTRAANNLKTTGQNLTNTGKKMTGAVTVPLLALGGVAVNLASNLEETRSKTGVVFGSMADDIYAMADDSAIAMGMSEQAALDYASTFGSIFKNMGIAEEETAKMSADLVGMISDYASFHDLDPGLAFEKIKAGLVGSSEPLISLGKDLRQGAVEAYALENGLVDADGAMSSAQLAAARFGQLMSQSTDEIGDFARTSDGVANSSRQVTGMLGDIGASFGDQLIPLVKEFLQLMIPLLEQLNALDPSVKENIVKILGLAAAIGPLLIVVGSFTTALGSILTFIGPGGALATAFTWISSVAVPAVGAALAAVSLPVIALVAAIGLLVFVIIKFGKDAWFTITTISKIMRYSLVLAFMFAKDKISEFFSKVKEWIDTAKGNFQGFKEKVVGVFDSIKTAISDSIGKIIEFAERILDIKLPAILTPGSPTPFENGLRGINDALDETSKRKVPGLQSAFDRIGSVNFAAAGGQQGNITIPHVSVTINGNANENDVRRGVHLGISDAMRAAGRA